MRKILKGMLIFIGGIILLTYLLFLVIPPIFINPVNYKSDIQQVVTEACGLNLDFKKARIITTPLLGVGLKADGLSVAMLDKKEIFSSQKAVVRLSLPSLLFKTVKITCFDVENPTVNFNINKSGTQYEVIDYFNERNKNTNSVNSDEQTSSVSSGLDEWKFKLDKLKITNFNINVKDKKSGKRLRLYGNEFWASFDGKTLHVKTMPELYYDETKNVVADIDLKTYIPKFEAVETTESPEPAEFINLVEMYGKYDLKTNIKVHADVKEEENKPNISGDIEVKDLTIKVGNLQLPSSYFILKTKGNTSDIDTKIFLSENSSAAVNGTIKHCKKFNADLNIKTDKIYFENVVRLAEAVLNSFSIKNELAFVSAKGFLEADVKVMTDLKRLSTDGIVSIAGGSLIDKKSGLNISNLNSKLLFAENMLKITETQTLVNGTPFKANGTIDENTNVDIKVFTDNLPLKNLYGMFAPKDITKAYALNSGNLGLNIHLSGKLEALKADVKTVISNLSIKDKVNNIYISDGRCNVDISTDMKTFNGNISNNNLIVSAPSFMTKIYNPSLKATFDADKISILPSVATLNGNSKLTLSGDVKNYAKKPDINIVANGSLLSSDLKKLAGKDVAPYLKAAGSIPVKLSVSGDDKKQNVLVKLYGTSTNYVTPIDFKQAVGKTSVLLINADISNNKIDLSKTGLYTGANLNGADGIELVSVSGGINLDKNMTLNNIKIISKGSQPIGICAFNKSNAVADVNITVSGTAVKPVLSGSINANDVNIPELLTKVQNGSVKLCNKTFSFDLKNLNLNGSSLDVNGVGLLDYKPTVTLTDFNLLSDYINADKAMKVAEASAKVPALSAGNSTAATVLPVKINSGAINIKKLSSGAIVAEDISSKMSLAKNVLYLTKLNAKAFEGSFNSDISMNIFTSVMKIKASGSNMNADKTITACAGMKGAVFGTLGFNADITLKGADYIQQMKTLNGKADFTITNGQFGTLGRFETFLRADNLVSNAFIATKAGTLINKVSPHNTAEFDNLKGKVTFRNGLMSISEIASAGKNMSMYIIGKMNLVNNNADMTVLGRISPQITSLLGPLYQLNPVNILKSYDSTWAIVTVGILKSLNQAGTPAEINKIPSLIPYQNDELTSKFIVKINGNVEKPQKIIKSFKWLSAQNDINQAEQKVNPAKQVKEIINSIPKTKEETVNMLKEAGKNTLMNIGKQLLNGNQEAQQQE